MSSALTVLRLEALQSLGVGIYIPNAYFDSVASTSITSSNILRNSNWGGTYFRDQSTGIFRPGAAAAADYFRPAGDLNNATGALSHLGGNYADVTVGTEIPELWFDNVRPDLEVIAALNRVTRLKFVTTHVAISHLSTADGDMALATDTNWTDVGTTSVSAKATTAGITPWGQRSYRTVNTSANSGTRSTAVRLRKSGTVSMFTIASGVGQPSLRPYNNTGTAVFPDTAAVTHTERSPQLLAIQNAVAPSTCETVSLNLTGVGAGDDISWNQAWLFVHDNLVCPLPSTITEGFMAHKLFQARPRNTTAANVYDAGSFDPIPLKEGVDFWLVFAHADAEPYKVRFTNPMPSTGGHPYEWPLFMEARLPLSSLTTWAADDTAATVGPLNELMPLFNLELLETVYNQGSRRHPDWERLHNKYAEASMKATVARPIKSVAPARPWYSGPGRM